MIAAEGSGAEPPRAPSGVFSLSIPATSLVPAEQDALAGWPVLIGFTTGRPFPLGLRAAVAVVLAITEGVTSALLAGLAFCGEALAAARSSRSTAG